MSRARKPQAGRRRHAGGTHYTLMHELAASPSQPLPEQHIRHQLTRMHGGLHELVHGDKPSTDSWRVLSDCVNLMETLVEDGAEPVRNESGRIVASHWPDCDGDPVEVRDSSGLLHDAVAALAHAGSRSLRGLLQDYAAVLQALPARTMVRCHRMTEKRVRRVWERVGQLPRDVLVMAL